MPRIMSNENNAYFTVDSLSNDSAELASRRPDHFAVVRKLPPNVPELYTHYSYSFQTDGPARHLRGDLQPQDRQQRGRHVG